MEKKLLATILKERKSFEALERLSVADSFSDPGKYLYGLVKEFYERDSKAMSIDVDILESRIEREIPKQFTLYKNILLSLQGTSSSTNLLEEVVILKKESIARDLSSTLLTPTRSGVLELMERYKSVDEAIRESSDSDGSLMISTNVGELIEDISSKNKIELFPSSLQEATGGAMRGNNILVFARPEVGKSLFIINLCAGFLKSGLKVLFIENEDPAKSTMSRIICRLAEKSIYEVSKNPNATESHIKKLGYDNLILKSMSPGTFREMQGLIDDHHPDVIIINQLRNIWVGKESRVEQMEIAATQARNLAKKNDILVVGVTQAGDSGTNKLRLEMNDIDFSNTGMPAQMDLIIGLGMNQEFENKSWRMISLPKNKLSGQHTFFPVIVDTKTNLVTSIL